MLPTVVYITRFKTKNCSEAFKHFSLLWLKLSKKVTFSYQHPCTQTTHASRINPLENILLHNCTRTMQHHRNPAQPTLDHLDSSSRAWRVCCRRNGPSQSEHKVATMYDCLCVCAVWKVLSNIFPISLDIAVSLGRGLFVCVCGLEWVWKLYLWSFRLKYP